MDTATGLQLDTEYISRFLTRNEAITLSNRMAQLKEATFASANEFHPFLWHIANIEKMERILREVKSELINSENQQRMEI